jgi:hypothetical protein
MANVAPALVAGRNSAGAGDGRILYALVLRLDFLNQIPPLTFMPSTAVGVNAEDTQLRPHRLNPGKG